MKKRASHGNVSCSLQGTKHKALQAAITAGVAWHNASMEAEDRALVEELFKRSDILVSEFNGSMHHCCVCC